MESSCSLLERSLNVTNNHIHDIGHQRRICILSSVCWFQPLVCSLLLSYSVCSRIQYLNTAEFPINKFLFICISGSVINHGHVNQQSHPSHLQAAALLLKSLFYNTM